MTKEIVDIYNFQVTDYKGLRNEIKKRLKGLKRRYLRPSLERLVELEEVDVEEFMVDQEEDSPADDPPN